MNQDIKIDLIHKLEKINIKEISDINVVLLPDFFVDHFLYFDNFGDSTDHIKNIYFQKGGNINNVKQIIHQGGNATNTALGLSRLGIKTYLICRTDEFGLYLLKYFLGRNGVDLSCVKSDGKLAITTAIEFDKNHINVMLGDAGSVSDFSFKSLDDKDIDIIKKSNMVCVFNWNLNSYGTDLASNIFKLTKKHNVKTYFDSGDPSTKKNEISYLMDKVLTKNNLDIFGLNENELKYYSKTEIQNNEDIIKAAKLLKEKIPARLDIHTSNFSFTVDEKCDIVPSLKIKKIYRQTGAGDAWNAGNIFADLLGFNRNERLLFSNIFAALYVSSPSPIHPTLSEFVNFINKN